MTSLKQICSHRERLVRDFRHSLKHSYTGFETSEVVAAEAQDSACQHILQCFAGRQPCVRKHTTAHTHSQRQRSKHNTILLRSQVQGRPEAPIDVNYNAWCSELDVSGPPSACVQRWRLISSVGC